MPRNLKKAYELDKCNGNTLWADGIQREVDLMYDVYDVFKLVDEGEENTQ